MAGCSLLSQPKTVVTLSPKPSKVAVGTSVNFAVDIAHDHKTGLGVNWTLNGAGALSNQQPFSVTYTAPASVPASPSVTIVATSQETSSSTDSATFTLNAIAGNNYIGAQSPGDVWLFTLDDTNNAFSAQNQTAGLSYTGTTTALPNGFLRTLITSSNDPNLPVGWVGYAIEIPNIAAMLALGGPTDKPVALVAQSPCPTLSGTTNVQLINLGKSTYDATQSESYAAVSAAQASSTYNLLTNSYVLDGTLRAANSGTLPSGTCGGNTISIPNVPTGNGPVTVTVAPAANGLYVIDLGPGQGAAIGSQNFVVDSASINAAMSAQYLGVVFTRNSIPITTFVGFGPGSGASISGGPFVNQDSDPFTAHGTNLTINLISVNANGFLQGTVTDSNTGLTHTPFVAMLTQNGGKYFLFGITTDISSATPYVILLAQQ
jgi:hypothetical protein